VIDGEIVALDQEGKPGFHLLLGYGGEAAEIVLYAFDLLMIRGKDVRLWPLEERRGHLFGIARQLPASIRYSERFDTPLRDLISTVGQHPPNSNSRVTSRHLRSGEDRDAALHVEFVAAVGVDMVPDRRGDGEPVAWREPIGPMGLGENLLKHEDVDEDHAILKQVQAEHADLLILAPVANQLAASGEEHEVIGTVPVLDDIEPIIDFPS
jgi:hypothetical protein